MMVVIVINRIDTRGIATDIKRSLPLIYNYKVVITLHLSYPSNPGSDKYQRQFLLNENDENYNQCR